jgi:hypothetical protein
VNRRIAAHRMRWLRFPRSLMEPAASVGMTWTALVVLGVALYSMT